MNGIQKARRYGHAVLIVKENSRGLRMKKNEKPIFFVEKGETTAEMKAARKKFRFWEKWREWLNG